jgi:hypothetical protein
MTAGGTGPCSLPSSRRRVGFGHHQMVTRSAGSSQRASFSVTSNVA